MWSTIEYNNVYNWIQYRQCHRWGRWYQWIMALEIQYRRPRNCRTRYRWRPGHGIQLGWHKGCGSRHWWPWNGDALIWQCEYRRLDDNLRIMRPPITYDLTTQKKLLTKVLIEFHEFLTSCLIYIKKFELAIPFIVLSDSRYYNLKWTFINRAWGKKFRILLV